MFLIENETLGLRPYTHEDDYDWYRCWQDRDTQKGYNGVFEQSFEEFRMKKNGLGKTLISGRGSRLYAS